MNPREQLEQLIGKEKADEWINIVKAILAEKDQPVNQTVAAQPAMEG